MDMIMSVKKVFVDTIKFATDRDLKKSLSTLIMLQDFHKKFSVNDEFDLLEHNFYAKLLMQLYIM